MDIADVVTMGGVVAIIFFLWRLRRDLTRDIADLRERMAKLEGAVGVLSNFLIDRERKAT